MFEYIGAELILIGISLLFSIISLIIAIVAIGKYRNIYRLYDAFMRGRDAESLEDLILDEKKRIEILENADITNREVMRTMNRNIRASFQKAGVVRYDAFEGMGGKNVICRSFTGLYQHRNYPQLHAWHCRLLPLY